MSEKAVLVTGASGFIGHHVVRQLERMNRPLRLLDTRFERGRFGEHELIEGSVADPDLVHRAVDGIRNVIHLAHIIDIDGTEPFDSVTVNILGTANLFRIAHEAGCRRLIWGSSVMTYGPPRNDAPAPENYLQAPSTFYGAGKLYLEYLSRSYRALGLDTVGLRLSTVFGPERDRGGAAPFVVDLFRKPAVGTPITIPDGDRRVDMIYGSDAAAACIRALDAAGPLDAFYNIGGFSARVRDIAEEVQRNLPQAQIKTLDGGSNPWPEALDCAAARRDLGHVSEFDLKKSVSDYIKTLSTSTSAAPP